MTQQADTQEPERRLEEASEAVAMTSLDTPGQAPPSTATPTPSAPVLAPASTSPAEADTDATTPETSATAAVTTAVTEAEATPADAGPSTNVDGVAIGVDTQDTPPAPAAPASPRKDSLEIEPSSPVKNSTPVCKIILLLPTNARHPFIIDEKYLSTKNVSTPELTEGGKMDPFSISVYTLKELILRDWRSDWETAPTSPGSIRLIFFGKLLDDKMPLREYNFTSDNSNIVHMTIKPPEIDDEEAAKGGKTSSTNEEGGGCGCCVIL